MHTIACELWEHNSRSIYSVVERGGYSAKVAGDYWQKGDLTEHLPPVVDHETNAPEHYPGQSQCYHRWPTDQHPAGTGHVVGTKGDLCR